MKAILPNRLAVRIASLKVDLLKEASPLLLGLFTIMFGLHSDFAITRTMQVIVPAGIGHFFSEPFIVAAWRVVAMVACALFICVVFIHCSITVVKMRLRGSLLAIYGKTFLAFYLSLSPWVSLHVARLVGSLLIPGILTLVDIAFALAYAVGLLLTWWVVTILEGVSVGDKHPSPIELSGS